MRRGRDIAPGAVNKTIFTLKTKLLLSNELKVSRCLKSSTNDAASWAHNWHFALTLPFLS